MAVRLQWLVRRASTAPFNKSQLCLALHSCSDLHLSPLPSPSFAQTIRTTLPYCDASETAIVARSLSIPPSNRWLLDARLHLAVAAAALAIPPSGHADNIDAIAWTLISCTCSPLFAASPSFVALRARLREELRSVSDVKKLSTAVLLNAAEALSWSVEAERHPADVALYRHLASRLRSMRRAEDAARCITILRWSGVDAFAGRGLPSDPAGIPSGTLELLFGNRITRPVIDAKHSLPPALILECAASVLDKAAHGTPEWIDAADSCVTLCRETLNSPQATDPGVARSVDRCRRALRERQTDVDLPAHRSRVIPQSTAAAGGDVEEDAWAALSRLVRHAMDSIMLPNPSIATIKATWESIAALHQHGALDDRLTATAVALTETVARSSAGAWTPEEQAELKHVLTSFDLPAQWRLRVEAAIGASPSPLSTDSSLAQASIAARAEAVLESLADHAFVEPEALADLHKHVAAWSQDGDATGVSAALFALGRAGALPAAVPWEVIHAAIRQKNSLAPWRATELARLVVVASNASTATGAPTAEDDTFSSSTKATSSARVALVDCLDSATAALIADLKHRPLGAVATVRALLDSQQPEGRLVLACCDAIAECRSALTVDELFDSTRGLVDIGKRLRFADADWSVVKERLADLTKAVARDATPPVEFCRNLTLAQIAGLLECALAMPKVPRGLIDTACRHVTAAFAEASADGKSAMLFDDAHRLLAALNALYVPRNDAIVALEQCMTQQMETTKHVTAVLACLTAHTPKELASSVLIAAAEGVLEATPMELQGLAHGLVHRPDCLELDAAGVQRVGQQALERLITIIESGTRVTVACSLTVLRAVVRTRAPIDSKRVVHLVEWLTGDALPLLDASATVDVLRFLAASDIRDVDYAHALTTRLAHFAPLMDTSLLSEAVFALSQCGGQLSAPLKEIADVVVDRAGDFNKAKPMIRLLHGFSKMGVMHRGSFNSLAARLKLRPVLHSATVADAAVALDAFSGAKYLDESVFTALSHRVERGVQECGAIDLALTAQSHADLYVINPPLFNSLADRAIEISSTPTAELPVGAAVRLLEAFGASGVEREDCAEAVVKRVISEHQHTLTAENTLRLVGALCDMQYNGEGLDLLAPLLVQHMESYNSVDLKELTVMLSMLNWRDDQVLRALGDHAVRLQADEALEPLTARCVLDTLQHFLHSHPIARAQLSDSARSVSRFVLPDDQPVAAAKIENSDARHSALA